MGTGDSTLQIARKFDLFDGRVEVAARKMRETFNEIFSVEKLRYLR